MYTLAGFYISSPLQCFPLISIYINFYVSKIFLLSFSISRNHTFHIFHRLDRFPGSFPMSSLPASPRYFFQSVPSCLPCPSVITFSQFVASYFTRIFLARCHIRSFPLFLIVSLHFPNSMPLISLMPCTLTVKFQIFPLFVFSLLLLFQFPLFISIVFEFLYCL